MDTKGSEWEELFLKASLSVSIPSHLTKSNETQQIEQKAERDGE